MPVPYNFFTLVLGTLLVTTSFAQSRPSIKEHWMQTQVDFESLFQGELNDLSCNRTLKYFIGCIDALNTALQLNDPAKIYMLVPSSTSNAPLSGFAVNSVGRKDPEVKEILKNYYTGLIHLFNEQNAIGLISHKTSFSEAAITVAAQVKNSGQESYHSSIIYNAYLNKSYDPHTYIKPRSYSENNARSLNVRKFYGLVYDFIKVDGKDRILISRTSPQSSADKAGIESGDLILDVDGEESIEKIREIMSKSDSMNITVEGSKGVRSYSLRRSQVSMRNVEGRTFHDSAGKKIAYIKLSTFADSKACDEIEQLGKKFMEDNIEGLILDLRNNGGGYVNMATCIMGLYLEYGSKIWESRELETGRRVVLRQMVKNKIIFKDIHTVVLQNGLSASAAEALPMYLQAYRKAYVVGERSFGKGTMQSVRESEKNDKILYAKTIATYHGPQGISPQIQGVKPDFEVFASINQENPTPFRREEDIYENAIVNAPRDIFVAEDRLEEIKIIKECVENGRVRAQYEGLDDYKKRVFDHQLESGASVIGCAIDLSIPVHTGTRLPMRGGGGDLLKALEGLLN
jgi:C-terminal peptidase prc